MIDYNMWFMNCYVNNLEEMKKFIDMEDFDINHENPNNKTALYIACRNKSVDTIEFLLRNGALIKTENCDSSLMFMMINDGFKYLIEYLDLSKSIIDINRFHSSYTSKETFKLMLQKLCMEDLNIIVRYLSSRLATEDVDFMLNERGFRFIVKDFARYATFNKNYKINKDIYEYMSNVENFEDFIQINDIVFK